MDFMESSISLKGNRRSGFVLDTGHERSGTCTSTYELDSFIKEDELPPTLLFGHGILVILTRFTRIASCC